MTVPTWREEPINKAHDRKGFDCGVAELNSFLRQFARQSHDSGGAKTFVAIDEASGRIIGFYSLAPASIGFDQTPAAVSRGLPRHDVPGFRLARLAVDVRAQGHGLGGQLLLAAGKRCLRAAAEIGGVALVIDAKNERVAGWYASYGALPLLDPPAQPPIPMIMALATLHAALKAAGKL